MDARFENGGAFIYTTSQEEEAGVGAITRACQSWRVMASSKPRSWKCICVCVKTSKSCLLPSFLFSYFIHKWSVYIYYRVRASYGWLTAALLLTRARAEQQQVTLWAGPGTSPYINIYRGLILFSLYVEYIINKSQEIWFWFIWDDVIIRKTLLFPSTDRGREKSGLWQT